MKHTVSQDSVTSSEWFKPEDTEPYTFVVDQEGDLHLCLVNGFTKRLVWTKHPDMSWEADEFGFEVRYLKRGERFIIEGKG